MPATRVGLLYSAVQTNVTNNTTIAAATTNAVAAGDTAFIMASARGATAGTSTISGLPGDAVVETINDNNAASPAIGLFRCYLPSGMAASTTITITWDSANSRKALQGVVWTGVANANNVANARSAATGGAMTIAATGATTVTGAVHVALWGINATVGTNTGAAGADTEGTMTEQADSVVGASTFHYIYAEDNTVTAAHGGGETADFTLTGTAAAWIGWHGIWAGAAVAGLVPFDENLPQFQFGNPWMQGPMRFSEAREELIFAPQFVQPLPQPVVVSPTIKDASAW